MAQIGRRSLLALSPMILGGAASSYAVAGSSRAVAQPAVDLSTSWRMPAEHIAHQRTWMCFPSRSKVWGDQLDEVQRVVAKLARTIETFEPVTMLVRPSAARRARRLLGHEITLLEAPVDDLWARDTLPAFLVNEAGDRLAAARFRFNGWGGRQIHRGDRKLAARVARHLDIPLIASGLTGEGGGLEVDGHGTVMAARSSWINNNRNPGLSEAAVSDRLKSALGADRVLWVDGLKDHDITDAHIDALARFRGSETILVESTGTDDVWGRLAKRTRKTLERATTARGKSYEIVRLKQPTKLPSSNPDFLPSYLNYYVCNDAVIVPKFGDRGADDRAHGVIADLYPGRRVVARRIDALAAGGGGIHCATQQEPVA